MAIYDYREPPQPSGPPPGTSGPVFMGAVIISLIVYAVHSFVQAAKLANPGF